jgi:hypothetical protein
MPKYTRGKGAKFEGLRALTAALAVTLLLALMVSPVWAQIFTFVLAENNVDLYINEDGTVRIVYDMTIVTNLDSPAVYVFDIGLPNNTYRLSEIQASMDGTPLTDLSDSPYVTPGVAVELGSHAIQPGAAGTLHFEAIVRDMIYQDSKDDEYASLEFAPTYFDSDLAHGTTRMEVRFHLPPGVQSDEPRYHDREFTEAYVEEGRVVYDWVLEDASPSKEYRFGASFPKQYLAEGVVQAAPAFSIDFSACCASPALWIVLFVGGWVVAAVLGARTQKRRKMKYMPPSLAVEGTGIKRGLTAVEAAVLLEAPLDRVMTMILFGLVKKGILAVESQKPLKVRVIEPDPKDKVWYYERRFLGAVEDNGKLDDKVLREMIIDLIGDVNKKLTGFSRKETKAYYKDIAARAWQQVEAADTPEVLGERWSDGLEWTMLEDDWDDRTREVFRDRPVVVPTWWWLYRPWATTAGSSGPTRPAAATPMPSAPATPVTLPTLPGADFANTVVSGVENAANSVVGSIESFTSGITQTTNPPPKPSSSSSRGGGYSCACACACAGCACACAGGGR